MPLSCNLLDVTEILGIRVMIEKNADNGPNPYASSYIPREKSKIVNKIEIRNKERQKYQNSLLHALPLKFLQFVKTEINDSLIFIIIPILKHCLNLLHRHTFRQVARFIHIGAFQ